MKKAVITNVVQFATAKIYGATFALITSLNSKRKKTRVRFGDHGLLIFGWIHITRFISFSIIVAILLV